MELLRSNGQPLGLILEGTFLDMNTTKYIIMYIGCVHLFYDQYLPLFICLFKVGLIGVFVYKLLSSDQEVWQNSELLHPLYITLFLYHQVLKISLYLVFLTKGVELFKLEITFSVSMEQLLTI